MVHGINVSTFNMPMSTIAQEAEDNASTATYNIRVAVLPKQMTAEQREAFARIVRERARELSVFGNLVMAGLKFDTEVTYTSAVSGNSKIDIMEGNDAY